MSPARVSLRSAVSQDAPAIAEIWIEGWRDGHLDGASPELAAARDDESFLTRARARVSDTTVAVVDGRMAGFVMVVGNEIEQVYVAALHRGAGVADVLMNDAEGQIREAGHRTAWLAVVPRNIRARRFYERRGWTDGGPFDYLAAADLGVVTVPCRRYVKAVEMMMPNCFPR